MLEQLDDEQVEDVVQLVEITNNVETTPPPTTAAPIEPQVPAAPANEVAVEVEPLSDSGDGIDALTAPTAGNADTNADAAGEPVVTATIPTALVAEGTEVSLSLQDSFQVQEAPSTDVAAASDPASGFSSTSPETAGDAAITTESPSSNAVDAGATEPAEPDAADSVADDMAAVDADKDSITDGDTDSGDNPAAADDSNSVEESEADVAEDDTADEDGANESVAEADDDTTDADAEVTAEDSAPATAKSATEQAPLVIAETKVDRNQAAQNVSTADAQATDRTVAELGLPDLGGRQTPSPKAIGSALTNIRQQVINAVRSGSNQP